MDVVIIEDERLTAERLKQLIHRYDADIEILDILPSVSKSVEWFSENSYPDLIFMDIQLNDGTGFDILKTLPEPPPVIFTTAYNEYALRAFKYNSIDYLLKPIEQNEFNCAVDKFLKFNSKEVKQEIFDYDRIAEIARDEYKKRFLIKIGDEYKAIEVHDIAYFCYDEGMIYLHTLKGKQWPIDYSLDQLERILNPMDFFRVNRKFLVAVKSVEQIHSYFNSRLLLKLSPQTPEDVIVSRDRVQNFKKWMDC
ncbi:LytTR family DNA-binding domain-containing protein [Fulvivirgaceae bacterium BMA10]|uniref:LytTR family DNA-binding domain-containing protein n=1 Tax=Splendidivirga corallicola TaxID=3051826 RepID=A0ABT8KKR6_9BACT|nr:LytTR family DNA-binding domain-containing protein [Fulvivirgaceae bacterium BMA10]